MTTLADLGYNEFLQNPLIAPASNTVLSQNIQSISGSKIKGGRIASSDGKSYLDLDKLKRLVINDGENDRGLFGKLD